MKRLRVAALLPVLIAGLDGQFYEPPSEPARDWLPLSMTFPSKITADTLENAERPAIARLDDGSVWIAWTSCRPKTKKWPVDDPDIAAWNWPDDGQDSVFARRFDGRDWHDEVTVSELPGVNHRPALIARGNELRVLWTARRDGDWAVFERVHDGREWSPEREIPGTAGALEVRAAALPAGGAVAVIRKLAPPRIELQALSLDGGRWSSPSRLDDGVGRCFRPHILALGGDTWRVAWDEERDGNYDVYSRSAEGPVERLTTSRLWDTAPTQARGPDGRAWVAWERRETVGGRFAYRGRSIFAKVLGEDGWDWAPSPFERSADPGRLTRHSQYWAAHAMSEERYPQLLSRQNGEMWLFWLGGGRMSSVSFSGRVLRAGKWSAPKLIFHDPNPYTAFQLPSVRKGVDLASSGRGPYQVPLANQLVTALDDTGGWLWTAYEVPRRRHIADRLWAFDITQRPGGYGADIYSHRIDLEQRRARFAEVIDEQDPIEALRPRDYVRDSPRSLDVNGERYRLVWGDMHGHTENDGIGTFDMYYAHGLFVTGMDFVASANHDFTPDFLTQSEWAEVQALAGVYEEAPGRVALSGWEWTTEGQDERGGHRAMYFRNDDAPIFRSTTVTSNTVFKLFSLIRPWDVILQPHHNDWTGYDPELQPVFEITSAWRQAREEAVEFKEQGPVSAVWEALERGYRIGFVGSGDSHWMGTGEDNGITGAYVKDLTRDGVFEAIRSRRVFASTGGRFLIDFRVNGAFMGTSVDVGRADPLLIQVRVESGTPAELIEVVKDHKVVHATRAEGEATEFEFLDRSGPRPDGKPSYCYLRVRRADQQYAWVSPVWVDWE